MKRSDVVVALLFMALGAALVVAASGFPPGVGPLPGPGFFPGVIGAVMLLLAAGLQVSALRSGTVPVFEIGNRRQLAVAAGLLLVYLLVWDQAPFAIRTLVFLIAFLRMLGERWRSSIAVSVVLTGAVVIAFQYGLRVGLG
ncbi:MAG: hypothetical protein FJW20_00575 [Acidimicrobiia bacterium]|nr:hypothetical protein [Acidimicrobiia bacterium]